MTIQGTGNVVTIFDFHFYTIEISKKDLVASIFYLDPREKEIASRRMLLKAITKSDILLLVIKAYEVIRDDIKQRSNTER